MNESDDLNVNIEMPQAQDGFVKTLNNTGYMTIGLDKYSSAFVEFAARHNHTPVMDVGAAYGVATLQALANGSTVIANDIDERHLQLLAQRSPAEHRGRLTLMCAPFPDLDLAPDSLAAVLICRVLHFLDGETIEHAAAKLKNWVAPGGKVFVVSETPYVGTLTTFAAEYEQRKAAGDLWPGLITDMHAVSPHAIALPKLGNWLDVEVLNRVFSTAGFHVEECAYFARPEFPQWLQLDGRESVGLIARKP